MSLYERHPMGFDAIEKGLLHCVMQRMCSSVRNGECAWEDAQKHFNIYTFRGRVKSSERLKRKLIEAEDKYGVQLTEDNFTEFIPDLVATRVVCLHHDDLLPVALQLSGLLQDGGMFEAPPPNSKIVPLRVRQGVLTLLDIPEFKKAGFMIDEAHKAGYTSIHFVFRITSNFRKEVELTSHREYDRLLKGRKCFIEIQLRTILEEAWGEVDHRARYEDERLANDPDLLSQLTALASYLQAGNHHVSLIRETAHRKFLQLDGSGSRNSTSP
ncbi:MAG: RelA/SpoT domain-containing protein [Vicinamibacterales bacterium]